MVTVEELEKEGKALVEQYQALEADQGKVEQSIQALRSQMLENQSVTEELELLEEDAEVFKALGPVLVKMDLADARATVKQRLDRLDGEVVRLDKNFKQKNDEKAKLANKINELQNQIRALQSQGEQEE